MTAFLQHITWGFSDGFLQSEAASPTTEVPFPYDVALAGLPYKIDTKFIEDFAETSIQLLRPQSDDSNEPGEASVNPEDFWRRSQHSWHHGAGQSFLDRPGSATPPDRMRFRRSKGVYVWGEDQITLLPDTDEKLSSTETELFLQPAGSRLYFGNGQAVGHVTTATAATWSTTAVTSTPAGDLLSMTSDGFHVWSSHSGQGVYVTNTGTNVASECVTDNVSGVIGYAKGRLMYAVGPIVYNIVNLVGPAAVPTALWTHPNTDFDFVGFAEGPTCVYGAGNSGDKAEVYRFGVKSDGSGLTQGIQAGVLADGELIYSIREYVGFVFLGTSKGIRMCIPTADGDLSIGDLIRTSGPVRCIEGQEQFVWFGWSNYDGVSTGLGRLNLRVLTDPNALLPAYATDLMVAGTADIISVATFDNKRYFSVSGDGFYGEDTNLVATGTIDSGWITFGIPDAKIAMYLEVRYLPDFQGSVRTLVAVDSDATYTAVGTHTEASEALLDIFPVSELRADRFEIRQELNRDGSVLTLGPGIVNHILKAQPGVQTRERIQVPLLVFDSEDIEGHTNHRNPEATLGAIRELCRAQVVTTLVIGRISRSVVVENYRIQYDRKSPQTGGWSVTAITVCKTV